jgi:hypothetical protein
MHIEQLIGRAYGREKNGREACWDLDLIPAPQAPNERKANTYVKKNAD